MNQRSAQQMPSLSKFDSKRRHFRINMRNSIQVQSATNMDLNAGEDVCSPIIKTNWSTDENSEDLQDTNRMPFLKMKRPAALNSLTAIQS